MNKIACLSLLLVCIGLSDNVFSNNKKQQQKCEKIAESIERLTLKRRRGGSAKAMNQWQKKRNDYKDQYSRLKCRQF